MSACSRAIKSNQFCCEACWSCMTFYATNPAVKYIGFYFAPRTMCQFSVSSWCDESPSIFTLTFTIRLFDWHSTATPTLAAIEPVPIACLPRWTRAPCSNSSSRPTTSTSRVSSVLVRAYSLASVTCESIVWSISSPIVREPL